MDGPWIVNGAWVAGTGGLFFLGIWLGLSGARDCRHCRQKRSEEDIMSHGKQLR